MTDDLLRRRNAQRKTFLAGETGTGQTTGGGSSYLGQ